MYTIDTVFYRQLDTKPDLLKPEVAKGQRFRGKSVFEGDAQLGQTGLNIPRERC